MKKVLSHFKKIIKMDRSKSNSKLILYRASIVICATIFLLSTFVVGKYVMASMKDQETYEDLQEQFHESNPHSSSLNDEEENDEDESIEKKEVLPIFKGMLEMNPDTVGWIRIANTHIDYPVVQGIDNEFYLNNNFKKQESKAGSIFMDYHNSIHLFDQNTVIYGHHMKNDTMFSDLIKYKNNDFLQKNPIIVFNTIYEELRWEIFSVYVSDVQFDYIENDFNTEENFRNFIDTTQQKSLFDTGVEVTSEDNILTLSTCDYDFDNARMVIHAKLLND
ncbi:class B sortase [Radiobacillus sp. PE A8.2]|uniref:class B sortase n=1 Tax=Radiobacillus sp. PE A8.2 TaxID=3380349 RepID=UPI003890F06F